MGEPGCYRPGVQLVCRRQFGCEKRSAYLWLLIIVGVSTAEDRCAERIWNASSVQVWFEVWLLLRHWLQAAFTSAAQRSIHFSCSQQHSLQLLKAAVLQQGGRSWAPSLRACGTRGTNPANCGLAMVLVEIASKRTDQKDILKQLLLEARGSDPSNADVRGHLIQLLSEAHDADEGDVDEM